jgi:hypothetical protein
MSKKMLFVLAFVLVLSMVLSACGAQGGDADHAVENAVQSTLFSVSSVEAQAASYLQNTCAKDAGGHCKTMGQ